MTKDLLVATRKGLFTVKKKGDWEVVKCDFLGDPVGMLLHDPAQDTCYASLDHGHFGAKLHRQRKDKWEEVKVPEYPPLADGEELVKNPMSGKDIPNKLEMIWSLASDGAGTLWCGTIPGGLFTSKDSGDSWQIVESLWNHPDRKQWFGGGKDSPGIHSICVHPDNPSEVAVAISCGGVWMSSDGGQNWETRCKGMYAEYMPPEQRENPAVQDPHCMVQCKSQPDHYWVQHHNGIFYSDNHLESWRDIKNSKPSTFGFAVAVHPEDGKCAWFLPAHSDQHRIPVDGALVLSRTRDGGQTFEECRKGLPQSHAYDLFYRHALDVDQEGNCLAFGSTTGSLWISENQGDDFQLVNANLPPVYALSFLKD